MAQVSAGSIRYSSDIDMDRIYSRILILDREERSINGQRVLRFSDNTTRYTSNVCYCGTVLWWKLGEEVMDLESIVDYVHDRLEVEGQDIKEVYYPQDPSLKSGATIDALDLNKSEDELKTILGEDLYSKVKEDIKPFIGKKGLEAKKAVQNNPIILDEDTAKEIRNATYNYYLPEAKEAYSSLINSLSNKYTNKKNIRTKKGSEDFIYKNYDDLDDFSKAIVYSSYINLRGNFPVTESLMTGVASGDPNAIKAGLNFMSKESDVKSRYQKLLDDYNKLDLQNLPKPKIEVDFFPTN